MQSSTQGPASFCLAWQANRNTNANRQDFRECSELQVNLVALTGERARERGTGTQVAEELSGNTRINSRQTQSALSGTRLPPAFEGTQR